MSHDHTHAPTATEGGGTKGMVGLAIIVIAIFIAVVFGYRTRDKTDEKKPTGSTTTTVAVERPNVIYAVTPATIPIDYEFNIESDCPLMMGALGIEPVKHVPGAGFQQAPAPHRGPKIFWSPTDSIGGRCDFRLYPVRNGR